MDSKKTRRGKLPSQLIIPETPKIAPLTPPVEEFKRQQSIRISSIDEIEVLGVIGQGSSAIVEKCLHRPTRVFVARKRVTLASNEEQQQQAIREVELLNCCKSPNVIHSYVTFVRGTQMDIIMEYMDCGSLKDALERQGSLPEPIIGHIAFQVLMGLEYLHKNRRIIHRDIKPSNLMLSSSGLVKISDFGVSTSMSHTNATKHTYVGTVTYMSPERFDSSGYHADTDIWSLGLSLLECSLGRFPYPEPDEHGNLEKLEFWALLNYILNHPAPQAPANSSADFKDFIRICLGKDTGTRTSCTELLQHPFIVAHRIYPDFIAWLYSLNTSN